MHTARMAEKSKLTVDLDDVARSLSTQEPLELCMKDVLGKRSYHRVYSHNHCSNYNDGWANFYPHANYYTVTYSPVICGHVSTQVIAVGQIGVWRLTHLDYT